MAVRLLNNSRRLVVYCSSLRRISERARSFSSSDKRSPSSYVYVNDSAAEETGGSSNTIWPDPNLGFLGPKDKRLTLPGNVGLASNLASKPALSIQSRSAQNDPEALNVILPPERHSNTLGDALKLEEHELEEEIDKETQSMDGFIVECVVQECPDLLKKDFSDLFVNEDVVSRPLTVITMTQKTVNDMSSWSEEVDQEREELVDYFVMIAEEICHKLKKGGYWADFIDPSSGIPYYGDYTNTTLFETDERYRHLGFKIEDLGCCKVIQHHVWGSHAFVGTIFTNAPPTSPVIKSCLQDYELGNKQPQPPPPIQS